MVNNLTNTHKSKTYDILILTYADWANTGYRFSKCLDMIGLKVKIIKGVTHPFNYPEQAPINSTLSKFTYAFPFTVNMDKDLAELITNSHILNMHASTYINPKKFISYSDVTMTVTHGGTTYRRYPDKSNEIFNPIVKKTIIQCPDLLNLGAKNEVLVYYPIDTELIKPDFTFKDPNKLIIGHFPSAPKNKGTKNILEVINKLKELYTDKFIYIGQKTTDKNTIPWSDNLKRYKTCDIIIETVNAKQYGKNYGEWGNTCLESAASGCVVLTNTNSKHIYLKEYNCEPKFIVTNNADQLENNLIELFNMDRDKILDIKMKTCEWVTNNHSFKATGLRLWNKVYKDLFPQGYNNIDIVE